MKRAFILFAIPIFLLRLPATAQDAAVTPISTPATTAATIAAREDAEERYKRLAADLQAVQSDNEALHAKITAHANGIRKIAGSIVIDKKPHIADATFAVFQSNVRGR